MRYWSASNPTLYWNYLTGYAS